jgi:hypothetical protein
LIEAGEQEQGAHSDAVDRGLVPGEEQVDAEADHLGVVELLVGALGAHEVGDHVLARLGALGLGESCHVVAELVPRLVGVAPAGVAGHPIDAFQEVVRTWPPELELAEHLRAVYTPVLDPAGADIEAVLAVVRMTHDEPVLRATYLVLRERAESAVADVLAERMGMPADALEVRMQAAATSAALRAATDHLVSIATGGIAPGGLREHCERLADALRFITRAPTRR